MRLFRKIGRSALLVAGLALGGVGSASGQTGLAVGDAAPKWEAIADNGRPWRSTDHVGKKIMVVYFYPAAMTAGCTKQACLFRDNRSKLRQLGAEVVGVSGDRVSSLKAFKGSNRLNFPLLSDSAGAIARSFGVPVRAGGSLKRTVKGKEIELKRDLTTARWTFIIDQNGRIAYKATDVDPEGDPQAVLAAIQRMTAN